MFSDPPNVAVVTTRSIVRGGAWIAHVSHAAEDGSWQFHDSAPGEPLVDDAMVVSLSSMVRRDGTLNEVADLPEGWRAWRTGPTAPWQRGRVGQRAKPASGRIQKQLTPVLAIAERAGAGSIALASAQ